MAWPTLKPEREINQLVVTIRSELRGYRKSFKYTYACPFELNNAPRYAYATIL